MTQLQISSDLSLPLEVITEAVAVLAARGAGKSNAAVVMAEEMYDHGLPWVAIDPKGDWHGIRSAGDGSAPGLSVVVFGGLHGDVPLEPTAGRLVADLIVDTRLTCVLDVSEMTKADQRRFLLDFAERLYRRNTEPLHVFCEEADEYIPQMVRGEAAKLVGAFETLVKRGRFRGLGVTLITQRSASLNKDVLTQVETLIAMRTPSPQDRKAILAWVDVHDAGRDLVDQLPTLESGEAWVFSPHALKVVKRIRFRRRRTFDSGATPKIGGKPRPPARLADVDLTAIKEAMAETIERAKADDPKELRKRIAELERHRCPEPVAVEPVRVEVPVLTPEQYDGLLNDVAPAMWAMSAALRDLQDPRVAPSTPVTGRSSGQRRPAPTVPPARKAPAEPTRSDVNRRPAGDGTITKPQQKVLDAFAWLAAVGFPEPTKIQVGFIAGYRVGKNVGGTFGNLLGQLRAEGLIDYPTAGRAALTDAGRAVANMPDIEPTTEGLQAAVHARLTDPESRVLTGIIDAYPDPISKQDAGAAAGYTVGANVGGTFGNILGRLRTLGLIDYPQPGYVVALPVLFLEQG